MQLQLDEKHIHTNICIHHIHIYMYIHVYITHIYISLFIKDAPRNISLLCMKHRDSIHTTHRLTVLPKCPLFTCFYCLSH